MTKANETPPAEKTLLNSDPGRDKIEPDASGEAAAVVNPVEALIARMEVHNAEGEAIDAELTRLGLTRKKVNSILSTKARILKEEALLANLTGAGS